MPRQAWQAPTQPAQPIHHLLLLAAPGRLPQLPQQLPQLPPRGVSGASSPLPLGQQEQLLQQLPAAPSMAPLTRTVFPPLYSSHQLLVLWSLQQPQQRTMETLGHSHSTMDRLGQMSTQGRLSWDRLVPVGSMVGLAKKAGRHQCMGKGKMGTGLAFSSHHKHR